MRTSVDLPDTLFRQAKATAALRGTTLKEFIVTAVQRELAGPATETPVRLQPPLVRSKKPGTLRLTNAEVEELLAG
jgi:hypothetical protein